MYIAEYNITISDRPFDCKLIGRGYDTIVEQFSMIVLPDTWKRLELAREYAKKKNNGGKQAYSTYKDDKDKIHKVHLGDTEFQIKPHGGGNAAFLLANDLYEVVIRHAKENWNVEVKYKSVVLWQYGAYEARAMIIDTLLRELKARPQVKNGKHIWQQISRIDYAFDFHSPEFTSEICYEMAEQIVCHSSVKIRTDFKKDTHGIEGYTYGTSGRTQTLTIGNKANIQVQIYDKGAEIKEASGKNWMREVWKQEGFTAPCGKINDVWRLEARLGRAFLSEEGIDSFEELEDTLGTLVGKAISRRRLVEVGGDSNKRRRKTHPLWGMAVIKTLDLGQMRPIGKQSEQCEEVVVGKAVNDIKAAIRRAIVVQVGDFDSGSAETFLNQIIEEIQQDVGHEDAIEKYQEKYKYLNCAR